MCVNVTEVAAWFNVVASNAGGLRGLDKEMARKSWGFVLRFWARRNAVRAQFVLSNSEVYAEQPLLSRF
mgnify:CR=1 FL=1